MDGNVESTCHNCPWARKGQEEMGSNYPVEEALELLRDINNRVVRMETLVDLHLGKEGTLPQLQSKVESMNSRVLLLSGGTTALLNALRYLPFLFK